MHYACQLLLPASFCQQIFKAFSSSASLFIDLSARSMTFRVQYKVMPLSKKTEDLIADFRGLPRMVSDSARRAPVQLSNLLVVLKEQYKLEEPSPERSLVENWEHLFGNLAGRCNPLRIKDGHILMISVTNQTLRSELQFRKKEILQRVRKLDHCQEIDELLIRG